jgi:hypothetical protein
MHDQLLALVQIASFDRRIFLDFLDFLDFLGFDSQDGRQILVRKKPRLNLPLNSNT